MVTRTGANVPIEYSKSNDFDLAKTGRNYDNQFFPMYQARLANLKTRVDKVATEKWGTGDKSLEGKKIKE